MTSSNTKSGDDLDEMALAWFVKIQSGDATPRDHQAFAAWLKASAAHQKAYDQLDTLWFDLDAMGDPRKAETPKTGKTRQVSRRAFIMGGAASAAAAAYVGIVGLPDFLVSDFYTGTGEQRRFALNDGSQLLLDADSAISVDFTETERMVTLQRGRAFFDIRADTQRDFVIAAAGVETLASNAQCSVHNWGQQAEIVAEAGQVTVAAPNGARETLDTGFGLMCGRDGLGEQIAVNPDQFTAWRQGRLVFDNAPLWQLVSDVNRYRPGKIVLAGSDLGALRISGTFNMSAPDAALDAITATLPVSKLELTPYLVVLRAA